MFDVIFTVITVSLNLFLGTYTYFNNRKSSSNLLLGVLTFIISLWSISNYYSLHSSTPEQTLFWIRMVMFFTAPLGPAIYLLVNAFPGEKINLRPTIKYSIIALALLTAVFALSPFMYSGVVFESGNIKPIPGPAIILFAIDFVLLSLLGFINLIRKYSNSEGIVKIQTKYFLFGIVGTFSIVILIFLTTVFWQTSLVVSLGPTSTLIMIAAISYAIVEHRLFNVRIFAVQAVTVVLWVILLSKIFSSVSPTDFAINMLTFTAVLVFGILLIRSVTSEIEQKEKLQDLTEKLQALDKQKDEFLSMAAHELRAPMTAIKGYVSMVLEGDTGDIPEKARGFLADTSNITDRLIRLVNNMLNVSRIEEGRLTYQEETEYLSVPVKSVFNQFVPEAERKGLKYTIHIPSDLKDKVTTDPDRIQEVIGNFISNAVKYTNEGFVKVTMLQSSKSAVRVEVSDSGPGISKEEQKNLFQKFHRVESNVGKTTGTGLGLYISKLLMERFKGKLGVESEPGKGSTFWFELPLQT